jgi:uncharacterized protein involved in type VI secretion and phage assembly
MNNTFEQDDLRFPYQYRGVVLDNVDPDKLGRIKVQVFGIFTEDIATAKLPWAVPAQPIFSGSGSGFGHFAVPEIDSQVFVFFEGGDVYQPVYWAEAPNRVLGLPSERTTNYPNRRIIKTKAGLGIYIDDTAKEIRIIHPTGKYIQMDSSGSIVISAKDVTINASGDTTVTATGDVSITGARIDLNP